MPNDKDADQLTISAVLDYYGADTHKARSRGWSTIRCPFHNDHHPSARVNLTKGAFWCPACGVKGDAIGIVMDRERLDFREANEFAKQVLGASTGHVSQAIEKPKRKRWKSDLFD